jgi:hypothetical protein
MGRPQTRVTFVPSSHHVIQSRPLVATFPLPFLQTPMDPHSSRSTFFSRVFTTPQPSNNPRSYPSTTRPHATTPSFFGKGHTPHSAGRNLESHMANQILQGGDSSASSPPVNTEDGSIYVGHKYHRYFSHSNEDANSRHSYDNMDGATHIPHPSRLEPSSRAGMLNDSLLSLEFGFSV